MVTIRFFAMLRNKLGKEEAKLPLEKEISLGELKETLKEQFPEISEYLVKRRVLISVNQEIALSDDTVIKSGDEVAILPSFSGGI